MKIVNKANNRMMFKDVKIGDVFKSVNSDNIYIKTSGVQHCSSCDIIANAVKLSNGLYCLFDDDVLVVTVEAELTIN